MSEQLPNSKNLTEKLNQHLDQSPILKMLGLRKNKRSEQVEGEIQSDDENVIQEASAPINLQEESATIDNDSPAIQVDKIQKPQKSETNYRIPILGNKFEVNGESITQLDADILNGLMGYFDKVTPFAKDGEIKHIALEKSGVKYEMRYDTGLWKDANDVKFIIVRKENYEEILALSMKELKQKVRMWEKENLYLSVGLNYDLNNTNENGKVDVDSVNDMGAKDMILKGNMFHELKNFLHEFDRSPNYSSGYRNGSVYLHEITFPQKNLDDKSD